MASPTELSAFPAATVASEWVYDINALVPALCNASTFRKEKATKKKLETDRTVPPATVNRELRYVRVALPLRFRRPPVIHSRKCEKSLFYSGFCDFREQSRRFYTFQIF